MSLVCKKELGLCIKYRGDNLKAVIDRFEGEYAVVLFGEDEIKVDIPKALLPEGAKEGSWLNINFELDVEGEMKQRERIENKLEKLRQKGKEIE